MGEMITATEHLSGPGINENPAKGDEGNRQGNLSSYLCSQAFSQHTLFSPPFVCGHHMCEQAQELLHHKIIPLENVGHGPGHKLVLMIYL